MGGFLATHDLTHEQENVADPLSHLHELSIVNR